MPQKDTTKSGTTRRNNPSAHNILAKTLKQTHTQKNQDAGNNISGVDF
jgi:hypothetical protein